RLPQISRSRGFIEIVILVIMDVPIAPDSAGSISPDEQMAWFQTSNVLVNSERSRDERVIEIKIKAIRIYFLINFECGGEPTHTRSKRDSRAKVGIIHWPGAEMIRCQDKFSIPSVPQCDGKGSAQKFYEVIPLAFVQRNDLVAIRI